jgi:hypothetical protein
VLRQTGANPQTRPPHSRQGSCHAGLSGCYLGLPLRQLEFDAAVLGARLVAVGGIERLEFAEAGGNQPVGRNAVLDL